MLLAIAAGVRISLFTSDYPAVDTASVESIDSDQAKVTDSRTLIPRKETARSEFSEDIDGVANEKDTREDRAPRFPRHEDSIRILGSYGESLGSSSCYEGSLQESPLASSDHEGHSLSDQTGDSSLHGTAVEFHASASTYDLPTPGIIPPDERKLPIAFALPDETPIPGTTEDILIHSTQLSFSESLEAYASDPANPEYPAKWKAAVESHDDFLRRTLGWERFNQLSAIAAQHAYQASIKND